MTKEALLRTLEDVQARLGEAEETLEAIRSGDVDAIVVSGRAGEKVYTLQGADQAYRHLVESISEGAITLTPDGTILYANQQFARMLGFPPDQIVGAPFPNYISTSARPFVERLFQNGDLENARFQVDLKTREGGEMPIQLSLNIADIAGERVVTAVVTDLTESERAREALRQSEATLDAFFEAFPGILNIEDEEFRYIRTDAITPTYFGLDRHSIVGKSVKDLDPEFIRDFGPMMRRVIETGRPEVELEVHSPVPGRPGETRYWRASYFPVPLEKGKRGIGTIGIDITGMKEAEAARRESEEQYRALFNTMAEGFALFEAIYDEEGTPDDFRHLEINPAYETQIGLKPEQVIGRTVRELFPDVESWIDVYGQVVLTGIPVRFEKYSNVAGKYWEVLAYKTGSDRVAVLFTDITKRKGSEDELRLSNEIMTNMSEGVALVAASNGAIIYTNPTFENLFGYDPGELIGKSISIVNASTDKSSEEVAEDIRAVLRDKGLWSGEIRNRKKDGTTFWCFAHVSTFKHSIHGDVWVSVSADITDRKRAELKQRESEALLRGTFEQAAVGIAQVSLEGRFILINQRFCDIVGYDREELLTMTFQDITYPDDLEMDLNYVQQVLEGMDKAYSREERYVRKNGHLVWVNLDVAPLRSETGKPTHFIAVVEDITERKRLEEEVERHRNYLEEMVEERTVELENKNITLQELNATLKVLLKQREDDKKDMEERFVTNVRNLVLPYVEQMKKGRLDDRQQTYLDIIEKHLHEIATPLLKNIRQFNLTPKEMKVAALVRLGKSTKEIAEILGTASGSISIHRKNIREKLGISSRKTNLQSYLASLEQ